MPYIDVKEDPVFSNIKLIVNKAKEHGKIAGIHNGTTQYAKEMITLGYQFLTISSDYRAMSSYAQSIIEEMKGGKDVNVIIQRYTGLGEMNASQLWDTTLNPEFRTLKQVSIDNAAESDRVFSMLMGDEVPPRREFIEANAKYANIDA